MSYSREDLVFLAKLAEQAEQSLDMLQYMNDIVALGQDLSWEERHLLSVAYKNPVSTLRRLVCFDHLMQRETERGNTRQAEVAKQYRDNVEKRLRDRCGDFASGEELDPYAQLERARFSSQDVCTFSEVLRI